jgi:cysteinyl-tRNA synthetase
MAQCDAYAGRHTHCCSGSGSIQHVHTNATTASDDSNSNTSGGSGSSVSSSEWCKHWLHTGHLHIEGLKMSKSLKNFITVCCIHPLVCKVSNANHIDSKVYDYDVYYRSVTAEALQCTELDRKVDKQHDHRFTVAYALFYLHFFMTG